MNGQGYNCPTGYSCSVGKCGIPVKALVYKLDKKFNRQEIGLLSSISSLNVNSDNTIEIGIPGPNSEIKDASLRIAGTSDSYFRFKYYKNNVLTDDFIMKVGGTDYSYVAHSFPNQTGLYRVETYSCDGNPFYDIDWSQHPYYSNPDKDEVTISDSLDLYKMNKYYPAKYPMYSNRCNKQTGSSEIRLNYLTTASQEPTTQFSSLGLGSCKMASNYQALQESAKGTPYEEKYRTTITTCGIGKYGPELNEEENVEVIRDKIRFEKYTEGPRGIYECKLDDGDNSILDDLRRFESEILKYEALSKRSQARLESPVAANVHPNCDNPGQTTVLPFALEGLCAKEYKAVTSSFCYYPAKECPNVKRCYGEMCEVSSGALTDYYNCVIKKLKESKGSYYCNLAGGGIVPWQNNFEGFVCDKYNELSGFKQRAKYPDGPMISLSKTETAQYESSSHVDKLNILFDISISYYMIAYPIAKEYYNFKKFDSSRDAPSFENYGSAECSVKPVLWFFGGCGALGHCSGMADFASLFFHKGKSGGNEGGEMTTEEFNNLVNRVITLAKPETGRYPFSTIRIISELNEEEMRNWCHKFQVSQNENYAYTYNFYEDFSSDNALAQMDADYFWFWDQLIRGYAPVVGVKLNPDKGHTVLVTNPSGDMFTVYDSNDANSMGTLTYGRHPGADSYFLESSYGGMKLKLGSIYNLNNIDLKQKNCGACYCGEATCKPFESAN